MKCNGQCKVIFTLWSRLLSGIEAWLLLYEDKLFGKLFLTHVDIVLLSMKIIISPLVREYNNDHMGEIYTDNRVEW
jgi:hypothetical protein